MKAGNYTAAQTALKAALGGTPIIAATVAAASTTLRTAAVNNAVYKTATPATPAKVATPTTV